MATKAERFRYTAERSGPKRAPRPGRRRRDVPVDTAQPGVSATDRRAGGGSTAMRNYAVSGRGARTSVYALEDTVASHRPSRKSSRSGSRNHIKTDSTVRRRLMKQIEGPTARHDRRSP